MAVRMGLPDKEADNIRVAALLQDINDIEVTARVIRKAVGDLKHMPRTRPNTRFPAAISSARWAPSDRGLAVAPRSARLSRPGRARETGGLGPATAAVGASIIQTVNRYVALLSREANITNPREAIDCARRTILKATTAGPSWRREWVVLRSAEAASNQAAAELVRSAGDEF